MERRAAPRLKQQRLTGLRTCGLAEQSLWETPELSKCTQDNFPNNLNFLKSMNALEFET